jgi:hypothetical protein
VVWCGVVWCGVVIIWESNRKHRAEKRTSTWIL